MRIENLEEFVVLAKHLNFTNAARELFIAQPTLSAHIKAMESELGMDLISRGPCVKLTYEGKAFLDVAQRTLDAYRSGCADLAAHKESHPLRICLQNVYPSLDRALEADPRIPYEFSHALRGPGLFDDLVSGELDALATFDYTLSAKLREQADSLGIERIVLDRGRRVSVGMSRSNPLSERSSLSSSDLEGAVVAIPDRAFFDSWKEIVVALMPDVGSLSFRLVDAGELSNYWRSDQGSDIVLCDTPTLEAVTGAAGDFVCFDRLDGNPMLVNHVLAYRKDDGSASLARLLERLHLVDGD